MQIQTGGCSQSASGAPRAQEAQPAPRPTRCSPSALGGACTVLWMRGVLRGGQKTLDALAQQTRLGRTHT